MFLHLNNYTYIFAEENPKANVDNTEEIREEDQKKTEEDTKEEDIKENDETNYIKVTDLE